MQTPNSILITGGAGFIGSNLALSLRQRFPHAKIVCMDNLHRQGSSFNLPRLADAGVIFHKGDIRDLLTFPSEPFELILECSAEPSVLAGYSSSLDYVFHTNLTGTYHCLEKAREWNARILFLSTSRVYPIAPLEAQPWRETESRFEWLEGATPGISPNGVREDLRMHGSRSFYGFTKYASEALIEEYRTAFGIKAIINRCGVVAGPWQMGKVDQGVVALWVFHHLFGKPLKYIGYGGSGKQVRDILHVDDLAELVHQQILAFDQWDGWLGNVAGGLDNTTSLLELTGICRDSTGQSVSISAEPTNRTADLRIFYADCSHLFARTDWRPQRSIRRIVADVASWADDNRQQLSGIV